MRHGIRYTEPPRESGSRHDVPNEGLRHGRGPARSPGAAGVNALVRSAREPDLAVGSTSAWRPPVRGPATSSAAAVSATSTPAARPGCASRTTSSSPRPSGGPPREPVGDRLGRGGLCSGSENPRHVEDRDAQPPREGVQEAWSTGAEVAGAAGGRCAVRPSEGRRHGQLSQCHDLLPRRRMPAGVKPSHLRRMQSTTDPQTGPASSASRPSTPPTGPVSRRRTTRRTPSSASWSRTAGRSWRTGRLARTAPVASPSSTASYAPRRG